MARRLVSAFGLSLALLLVLAGVVPAQAQTPPPNITGTITNASASGAGVGNVSINAYRTSDNQNMGLSVTCPSNGMYATCADGTYQITGLQAGSYYIATRNNSGLVDQYYSAGSPIACGGCQPSTSGASVVNVVAGVTTPNINMALTAGPRISGTLSLSSGGTAPANVRVDIFKQSGSYSPAASAFTNSSGIYTTGAALPVGTYVAITWNSAGLVDRIYTTSGGVDCPGGQCSKSSGTGIPVSTADVPNIDMTLSSGGVVTGTIKNKATSALVSNANVSIYSSTGSFIAGSQTNSSGVYTSTGLLAGQYLVRASASGLIAQVYGGCSGNNCQVTTGTLVSVSVGTSTTVNIELDVPGTLTGHILDAAGNPIAAVNGQYPNVQALLATASYGPPVGFANADSSGAFSMSVPAGTYVLRAYGPNGSTYISSLYMSTGSVDCFSCDTTKGTPVSVAAAETKSGLDFKLSAGGIFSGTIKDNAGNPIPNMGVQVYNTIGGFVTSTQSMSDGTYSTPGMPAGTYLARTQSFGSTSSYVPQMWQNIPCLSCSITSGTPIAVTLGNTTASINFALDPGGSITGKVTDAASGNPIVWNGNFYPFPQVFGTDGSYVTNGNIDSSGNFTASGLATGKYFVRVQGPNGSPYMSRLYVDATPVGIDCSNCDVTAGTPISVTVGAATSIKTIPLTLGGSISGTVTAADGTTPISNVGLNAFLPNGSPVGFANTDSTGKYTIGGLPSGSYFVRTNQSPSSNFVPELYGGAGTHIVCVTCNVASGMAVPVVTGTDTTNINFSLSPGVSIGGTVTNAGGQPIGSLSVEIRDGFGNWMGSSSTNSTGKYTVAGLAPGTYFAKTSNSLGYIDQAFDGVVCINCVQYGQPPSGTPIKLDTGGASKTDVNFTLAAGGRITGMITDESGSPLASSSSGHFYVNVYNSAGQMITSGQTSTGGIYTTSGGLATGTYYLMTSNDAGFINVLYDSITCFGCSAVTGKPVSVTTGATTTGINFALKTGARISGTIQTANAGGTGFDPVPNVTVQAYSPDDTHRTIATAWSNALGVYTLQGFPSGKFLLRTYNQQGFIDQLYKDSPCVGCDVAAGTLVTAVTGATTTGVDFTLATGGSIAGTVRESAAPNNPIANVNVQAYNAAGQFVTSANTLANGSFVIRGLSAGSYYVKTSSSLGYINKLHASPSDIVCNNCMATSGAPVIITGSAPIGGIDFLLDAGGTLKGRVTNNASSPVGLAFVNVGVFTTAGSSAGGTQTDMAGNFTIAGLVPGDYLVRTNNSQGYLDQVYDGLDCVNCNPTAGTPVTITLGQATTIKDFKLASGGRITGRVADTSANPIQNVRVDIYRANGSMVTSAFSTADGTYVSSGGLPDGDYVLRTNNSIGYVDKLYDDVTCLGCTVTTGKLVTVAGGATVAGINFTLATGGAISGTVTSADGSPLGNVWVQTYSSTGTFVSSSQTNGLGQYKSGGLPTGTYFARTQNSLGYIEQLYSGFACVGCPVTSGKPIGVTVGSTTSGIDFSLTAGGRITGTLKSATTGTPVWMGSVSIYTTSGMFVSGTGVAPNGTYTSSGLPAGNYVVRTFNSMGYINLLHASPADIVCTSCNVSGGAPVPVTLGAATTVDFSLPDGGSFSGIVKDSSGTPLANVSVQAYTPSGLFVNSYPTGADGTYKVGGLVTGTYVARTSNSRGYIDKQYNDQTCVGCSASAGDTISVTTGSDKGSIDFSLVAGGRITGTITDASTTKPIPGIRIDFFDKSNLWVAWAQTDTLGQYVTQGGLSAGDYYARTNNSLGYINVVYPNLTCQNCPASNGTAIPVTVGQSTSGIDFALASGGRITGTITDAATGQPIPNIGVTIFLADGTSVGGAGTNYGGMYSTQGLPTGTYYVRTNNSLGYVNRLYDAVDCMRCAVSVGKGVSVTAGTTTSAIDFALNAGGRISGTVTDATTGTPLSGVSISVVDSGGYGASGATTNANGEFTTSAGLIAGKYYVRTRNSLGYVNKLYDNFTCVTCNATTGQPVTVSAGSATTGINFALAMGSRISGKVISGDKGLANVGVNLFSSGGTFLTYATTGSGGEYVTGDGLPAGSYYLVTANSQGLVDQLYDGNSCGYTCAVTTGKAVTVGAAETASDINFNLSGGGRISGRITDKASGNPLANMSVGIFNTAGAEIAEAQTDGLGNYVSFGGLAAGSYYVQTLNSSKNGYINKLYSDLPCPACDVRTGTAVAVTVGATTPNIDLALETGELFAGTVKDAATGQALSGASVYFFDSTGKFVAGARSDDSGGYSTSTGVPAGTYFARTQNGLGYVDQVYDAAVCLACDVTRGKAIAVDGSGVTEGIDFSLAAGGRLTGTVTAAATGATVAGSKIRIFNQAGSFLGQVYTNGTGVYTSMGLPPGNYYVRTANKAGLIDRLYKDVTCAPCTLSDGTPVTIVTAGLKPNIDFALEAGGLLSGYVTDQTTGSPIQGVTVSVYKSSDGSLVAITEPTDTNGYYSISLPVGTYQVEPNPIAGFRTLTAGLRGAFARSTVTVETGTETSGVGFSLVSCPAVTLSPATLPAATTGEPYSQTITSNSSSALTYSVSSGTVTTGLSLSATGVLAGTPAVAGTANFTAAGVDTNGCAGTRDYALFTCAFALSSTSVSTSFAAGSATINLLGSGSDCKWTAASAASWLTVTGTASGTGDGSVTIAWTSNYSTNARVGTVTVGGQTVIVTQGGLSTQAPFGQVDSPEDNVNGLSGSVAVTGWALDDLQVTRVMVSRDPVAGEPAGEVYVGDAVLVTGARPDVAATYSTLPNKDRAGWGYLLLSNMLPNQGNGTFVLHMDAVDGDGNKTRLGSRTFTADNQHATVPFGAIDFPGQGETISGPNYTNWGWGLTPQPKTIPIDGSTITVFIDGAPVGHVNYNNHNRPDVAALFPGLNNTDGASAYRSLDTTTLINGVHTISWVITDDNNEATGVGSRYFTVNNLLASQRVAPAAAPARRAAAVQDADAQAPVRAVVGFGAAFSTLAPDKDGVRRVTVGSLSRLALQFAPPACGAIAVGALPAGAALEGASFTWQPGPAFVGTYRLEFTVPSCSGASATVPVEVTINPGR